MFVTSSPTVILDAYLQAKDDAACVNQAVQDWTSLTQQLSSDPVGSLSEGKAAVTAALDQIQSLQEQQGLASEDLAAKDEALVAAEDRIGQ